VVFILHARLKACVFSQHVHKLLLGRVHFRTRLAEGYAGFWQTGLPETLS
jgi:hypothetical protein